MKRSFSGNSKRIRRWLESGILPLVLAGLAIALALPVVGTGLQYDDYLQREILQKRADWAVQDASIVGMFSFLNGDLERTKRAMEFGLAPWWTFEEIRILFYRPLTEITHLLDYRLWPDSPALMHAHSLFWFAIMVYAAAVVYRRIMEPKWVAGIAAFLFAVDDSHAIPVGWLANRNTLIAAALGFITLIVHDRWRREGWKAGAVIGPLCLLLGLLSAEAAIATGAYLVSYEIFLVRGKLLRKVSGLFPYAFVTIAWWLTYHRLGFGAWGSGFYTDPGQEPLLFLRAVVERMPILLFGQWFYPPVEHYGYLPAHLAHAMWLFAIVFLAVGVILLQPVLKRDAVARFWALGMLLALLPVCSVIPERRLLIFVGLGGMGLLARFLSSWFIQEEWLPASRTWRELARVFVVIFVAIHCIVAPLELRNSVTAFDRIAQLAVHKPLMNLPEEGRMNEKTVVFLNPPIAFCVTPTRFIRAYDGRLPPKQVRILASGMAPSLEISRIDERSLELQPESGFIAIALDRLFRGSAHPMQVGQRVTFTDMTAEVLSLTDDKRPLRVRFTFALPLNDPSFLFLEWKEKDFVPFNPPAVGRSVRLPWVTFPL